MWLSQSASTSHFNIKGVDDGRVFQTTFKDAGYYNVFQLAGGTAQRDPSGTVANGLTLSVTPELVHEGRYAKITYTVENTGSVNRAFNVGAITNNNGALTAAITGTGTLEYVWSQSPDVPGYGWRAVTSGDTVTTRQTSGVWYLHARATSADGWTVTASQSVNLSGGAITPPSLTVSANNTD